jgi:hypothetical protein
MGVRTLFDPDLGKAVMYDSVTDTAFGPLFESAEDIEAFLAWLHDETATDPRQMADALLTSWLIKWDEARSQNIDWVFDGQNRKRR